MLIDNKYEVKFKFNLSEFKKKIIKVILLVPKNLKNRGILDQLEANTLGEIFDDFPLN